MKWVSLVAGGALGTLARYLVSGWVYRALGNQFPYGTLAVNLVGCFIIGFLAVFFGEIFFLGHQGQLFLVTGFCGAFTTFSALMIETAVLMQDGFWLRGLLNIMLSVLLGFLVFKAGMLLGKSL